MAKSTGPWKPSDNDPTYKVDVLGLSHKFTKDELRKAIKDAQYRGPFYIEMGPIVTVAVPKNLGHAFATKVRSPSSCNVSC